MKVLAYDPVWDGDAAAALNVTRADPETIYRTCDILSLHLPLTDETRGCIGRDQIALMKPGAILINTARGGLIDEAALLDALRQGGIGGAGIDAFAEEPPSEKEWYTLENVVIGSHCAASTVGAARRMGRMATESLIRDLRA
jgi:D-3-phosphoglycerate dehydrogenase